MDFKQYYPSNNEINKKKYKKHSMSPFISLYAGDVEKNIEVFNHVMGTDSTSSGDASATVGESLLENNEDIIDSIIYYLKPGLDWLEDK